MALSGAGWGWEVGGEVVPEAAELGGNIKWGESVGSAALTPLLCKLCRVAGVSEPALVPCLQDGKCRRIGRLQTKDLHQFLHIVGA